MYLRESIRKILNEEISSQVRRRIPTFEETFKHYRKAFIDYKIRNFEAYWNLIMVTVSETLYHAWFINTVPDDDWEESEKYIQDYLTKNYHNETEKMWEKKHRKRLNESKTINYPKLINDILSSYKEEDFICDIDVSYYNEVYEVAVKIDKKEFEKKYEKEDINYATILMTGYLDRLKRNITRDIKTLLPVDVLVWFRQINCDKKLNESEVKKSTLLSFIEENGLYDIIANTGLHVNEVEQKVGQLSREVLERFIKDVVKEHFQVIDDDGKTYIIYLEDYPYDVVPIGNSDYVDQLRVTNNELFILVTLYEEDEYGDLEEQSYEIVSPKNLLYANIYEIAGQLGFLLSKGSI
jgi:hypothetical protein